MTEILEQAEPLKFDPHGYRSLISRIRYQGYRFVTYGDNLEDPVESRQVILRHDVDFSVEYATEMATIEREMGIGSTYFLSVRSNFYNPLVPSTTRLIRSLVELGHEIGLHVDLGAYQEPKEDSIRFDMSLLHSLEPLARTDIISIHRPAKQGLDLDHLGFGSFRHTYDHAFFRKMCYMSDSTGRWRFGTPLNSPSLREGRSLQILIHPIWWIEEGDHPSEKLERFLSKHQVILGSELAESASRPLPNQPEVDHSE